MSIKKKSEDSVPRDTSASNEININRSISLNRNQNKRSASREQESRNFSARSSSGQSRTGFDRKSMRSVPSGSSSVCSRSTMSNNRDLSKRSFKCEYLEATEAVPILIIAAQKQKEVIQMLQYEKMEFQRKLADGDDKSDSIISDESLGQSSLENVNFSLGDKQSCKFDESYNNYLDEIMHVWINLFYFILNIRINLIKLVNRSGKECFVPNMKVEKDILTRATESIRFFSALKMKSLTEALDQLRQKNESKKSDIELIEKEEVISSSFISEMEYLGNKTRDIVSRLKKIHERDSKI